MQCGHLDQDDLGQNGARSSLSKGVDAIASQKDRVPLEKLPEIKADWVEFGAESGEGGGKSI